MSYNDKKKICIFFLVASIIGFITTTSIYFNHSSVGMDPEVNTIDNSGGNKVINASSVTALKEETDIAKDLSFVINNAIDKKIDRIIENISVADVIIENIQRNNVFEIILDNGKLVTYLKNGSILELSKNDTKANFDVIKTEAQAKKIGIKNISKEEKAYNDFWFRTFIGLAFLICIGTFILMIKLINKYSLKSYEINGKQVEINQDNENVDVPDVSFDDVQGCEELKENVQGIVSCLKNPEKLKNMGARMPKGIVLYGPPGTGKTLTAKAIAGTAGVPFFSASGSDFVELYVGVGAKRVRELYKIARANAPCIVFIDEIDAVGGKRGDLTNSERDQTINALLTELDGFDGGEGVLTICATNRIDMLDPALIRAGRFDLHLAVPLPDKNDRLSILKKHAENKVFKEDVDFENLAAKTIEFSGADLEALLNEAALNAIKFDKEEISNEDIEEAFFKIVMKGNKKKYQGDNYSEEAKVIAWHEAGHTLATRLLTKDKVLSVTIIGSTSGAGGVTFRNPEETMLKSKKYLRDSVKIMYAGRAAEEIYFNDNDKITTGASQDIRQATEILKEYLAFYGMGDMGMIDISQFQRDYSEVVYEASEMSKKLYEETLNLLRSNADILEKLVDELLIKETLTEKEIEMIIFS